MKKKILGDMEYTFDASAKTITFAEDINIEYLLLITNINSNDIIYNFACDGYGGTYNSRVLNLEYDTTLMSDNDVLSIIIHTTETSVDSVMLSYLNEIKGSNKTLTNINENLLILIKLTQEMF